MTDAIRPIQTRALPTRPRVISQDAIALRTRLERTNQHCRGIADVLEVYVEDCRRAGIPAAAKAIESAIGHLHVIARLNERAVDNLEKP